MITEKEVRKIIMEELIRDIKSESVNIYDLVYQSFRVEGLIVERAKERTAEVTGEFTDRLVNRLKEMQRNELNRIYIRRKNR